MRLLGKEGIVPRAYVKVYAAQAVVRMQLGALWYVMDADEAVELARELVDAADKLKTGEW
jgi:hypothetical protein